MSIINKSANNTKKKHVNERAHQMKIYSIGSVVLLGLIILLINVILDVFLGKNLTFDFSIERSNSITEASEQFLDSIPDGTKIRIVGLFLRPSSTDEAQYQQYQYIIPLLDDYVKKGKGKVTVEYTDITMNPGIISELDPTGSYDLSSKAGQFVVSCNGKLNVINPINCYTIDTDYLAKYDVYMATANNTEYTFTNAMMSLVKGYSSKAYVIAGNKEVGTTQLKRMLNGLGMETNDLDVVSGFKVPDDCSLLVLNCPDTDITETMYVEMKAYVARGGKVIVAVGYNNDNVNEPYTNLNRFLGEMNINIERCMVSENDPTYQLNTQINDSLADIAQGFADFSEEKKMHITLARPLSSASTVNAEFTTVPVLMTSKKATRSVAGENNTAKQIEGEAGVINVAMYAANIETRGEVFVFGTENFTSDLYYSEFTLSDKDAGFFRACVRSMVPTTASYNIDIPVKKIDSYMLAEDKATTSMSTVMMIVFMIVLPIICSTAAVIVYNKRKNL